MIKTLVDITNANITNIAVVTSDTPDPNETNNKDNDTTEIDPEADIQVIKTVSNPTPYNGDTVTWTIIVTNLGPDTAYNVKVAEELPAGLKLVSAKGSKGSFNNGVWTIGTLNNKESVVLVLTTKVVTSDTVVNVVVGNTSTYDPNLTNNNDTEIINPKPVADLELIKTSNVKVAKVGDKIIWTIKVTNLGPDKAVNAVVHDIFSGEFEYIKGQASKGEFEALEGLWTIGDLDVGETVTLKLYIIALEEGVVSNFARVTSDTYDPDMSNNNDSAVVVVKSNGTPSEPPEGTPDEPPVKVPGKTPDVMHATGNPVVMAILALLAVVGVSLRRKI